MGPRAVTHTPSGMRVYAPFTLLFIPLTVSTTFMRPRAAGVVETRVARLKGLV